MKETKKQIIVFPKPIPNEFFIESVLQALDHGALLSDAHEFHVVSKDVQTSHLGEEGYWGQYVKTDGDERCFIVGSYIVEGDTEDPHDSDIAEGNTVDPLDSEHTHVDGFVLHQHSPKKMESNHLNQRDLHTIAHTLTERILEYLIKQEEVEELKDFADLVSFWFIDFSLTKSKGLIVVGDEAKDLLKSRTSKKKH